MLNGMANVNITYKLIEGVPDAETFESLKTIYTSVFEDADITFFEKRFQEQEDLLSVLAFCETKLVGFKIGYRYNDTTFYSWVGGVLAEFRQQGIAQELAKLQESWTQQNAYKKLRTKSMNRFKPMMILNLKNGFNIIKVYTNEKEQTKVIFEKTIG